jgi:hypothetical protein
LVPARVSEKAKASHLFHITPPGLLHHEGSRAVIFLSAFICVHLVRQICFAGIGYLAADERGKNQAYGDP